MPTFAVTDSDWDWVTKDGNAVLIEAATPEEAGKKTVEKWKKEGLQFDGVHMKIAELKLVGFLGWDREENPDGEFTDLLEVDDDDG